MSPSPSSSNGPHPTPPVIRICCIEVWAPRASAKRSSYGEPRVTTAGADSTVLPRGDVGTQVSGPGPDQTLSVPWYFSYKAVSDPVTNRAVYQAEGSRRWRMATEEDAADTAPPTSSKEAPAGLQSAGEVALALRSLR